MKNNHFFSIIFMLFVINSNIVAQDSVKRRIGISASIQGGQFGFLVPIWLNDKITISPAIDFKYADNALAEAYSEAADYPEIALAAIQEMKRLKGTNLMVNEHGYATSGVIVRHLILPNQAENSLEVLRRLAIEITPMITVSLMSQYYPTYKAIGHPELGRQISPREYEAVQAEMERLGLCNGWWQDFESPEFYRPDFTNEQPFE